MFFSFPPTEILYISSRVPSSRVLLNIFRFNFSFYVNNGLEKKRKKKEKETCPFKVILCFLSFKKSDKTRSSLLEMPICFSLKIIPSAKLYQTLLRYQEKHFSIQTRHEKTKDYR